MVWHVMICYDCPKISGCI